MNPNTLETFANALMPILAAKLVPVLAAKLGVGSPAATAVQVVRSKGKVKTAAKAPAVAQAETVDPDAPRTWTRLADTKGARSGRTMANFETHTTAGKAWTQVIPADLYDAIQLGQL